MRKFIKILLAALLVFFVAAPMIVGLYDAANHRGAGAQGYVYDSGRSSYGVGGSIGLSNLQGSSEGGGEACSESLLGRSGDKANAEQSGDDQGRISKQDHVSSGFGARNLERTDYTENTLSIADWYSGDSAASDSLGSGAAHLVYEFNDGTVVDFGNPYILDWSDVSKPDDFDAVVSGAASDDPSIFAPEKAYAGPIGWLTGKLKYLAIKSGYWKSFQSMFYSMGITMLMSSGMTYTASTQCINKVVAEMPAITRVITSETAVFTTEDTAMLVANSISRVAARKVAVSEFPSALNAEIAANVTAVETTGMLAGGASGNFVNAMYQLAATAGVPASILFADIGLYIGSWLGGNFDDYFNDLPGTDVPSLTVPGIDFPFAMSSPLGGMSDASIYFDYAGYTCAVKNSGDVVFVTTANGAKLHSSDYLWVKNRSGVWKCYNYGDAPSDFREAYNSAGMNYLYPRMGLLDKGVDRIYLNDAKDIRFYSSNLPKGDTITTYIGGVWSVEPSPSAPGSPFAGQIVGQDAQLDGSGNVVDYGNIKVNDVTAGDYQAPTTWQGALDQMGAAGIEQGATSTDQIIGQPGTNVGDWIGQNQTPVTPSDPSRPGSEDDFKVSDLEKVFPFCVPWDIYYLLSALNADPVAPNFVWTFDFAMLGKHDFAVDLSPWDGVANVVRTCETLLFCVGLAFVTRDLIRG